MLVLRSAENGWYTITVSGHGIRLVFIFMSFTLVDIFAMRVLYLFQANGCVAGIAYISVGFHGRWGAMGIHLLKMV